MELYTNCWEKQSLMNVITLLFPIAKMKKIMSLKSLEEKLCYGTKGWDIMERRVFNHYKVKVWLKVFQNVILISISVRVSYMENIIMLNSLLELQGKRKFGIDTQ